MADRLQPIILTLSLTCGACRHQAPAHDQAQKASRLDSMPSPTPQVKATTAPWLPDTFSLTVTKPVVIANAAMTQGDIDANTNQGLVEIIDDFDTYLGGIQDSLAKMGVDFQSTNTLVVRLRVDTTTSTWTFDRGSVGYLFAAPRRLPRQLLGVHTADDIIPTLREYLH